MTQGALGPVLDAPPENPNLMQPEKVMHQKVSCSLTRHDCSDIRKETEDGEPVFRCENQGGNTQ